MDMLIEVLLAAALAFVASFILLRKQIANEMRENLNAYERGDSMSLSAAFRIMGPVRMAKVMLVVLLTHSTKYKTIKSGEMR